MILTNAVTIPDTLRRFDIRVDGKLWMRVLNALPERLATELVASVRSSEPSAVAIRNEVANGGAVEGAEIKRFCHLRIA